MQQSHDVAGMTLALALGRRGLGWCWPNPSVGAVIADGRTGRIISCGWTGDGGRPHAEAVALAAAGEAARGATLYATLEPCSHWGKTPPCADALIAAGIARVVYGAVDADPRVAGRGLARLGAHGVEIAEGPFPREARWLALGHSLRVTAGRPFVQLKLAVDADGMVPAGNGAPVWVTGPDTRAYGHLLRAGCDAILAGSGTIEADDPELTCRLPGLSGRSPIRVVFASRASLPPDAKIWRDSESAPVWVVGSQDAPKAAIAVLEERGAIFIGVKTARNGRPDIAEAMHLLAGRGITRVLVEGGPSLAASFLDADLIDEAILMTGAARSRGERIDPFPPKGIAALTGRDDYRIAGSRLIGQDRISIMRRTEFW